MKIKHIEFVFENCEAFQIDGKYIGAFYMGKLEFAMLKTVDGHITETVTAWEEINKNQKNKISELGNLYIMVGNPTYAETIDINDAYMVDLRKRN